MLVGSRECIGQRLLQIVGGESRRNGCELSNRSLQRSYRLRIEMQGSFGSHRLGQKQIGKFQLCLHFQVGLGEWLQNRLMIVVWNARARDSKQRTARSSRSFYRRKFRINAAAWRGSRAGLHDPRRTVATLGIREVVVNYWLISDLKIGGLRHLKRQITKQDRKQ